MIFITGPLYSGKRTFAQRLPGTRIAEVQALAAEAEDLEKLAEELSAYDIVMAPEVGGGVGRMGAGGRGGRGAAGRVGWLLAGGIIYTIGGVIYALKLPIFYAKLKNFGSHEIFHVFIMLGSACHFIVMYCFVANMPI